VAPQRKRRQEKRHPSNTRGVAIRGIRHDPPDIRKLAKVIVSLATTAEQAEDAPEHDPFVAQEAIATPDEQRIDHSEAA
jgi:hypothetical protein